MSSFFNTAEEFLVSRGMNNLRRLEHHLECDVKVDGYLGILVMAPMCTRELGYCSIELHEPVILPERQADVLELILRVNRWLYLSQILYNFDTARIATRAGLPMPDEDLTDFQMNLLFTNCLGVYNVFLPKLKSVLDGTASPAEATVSLT